MDTGLGYTVVVLNSANADGPTAGAGLTVTSNAVSGKLFNPSSTYSGNEGEMTWCIYGSDDTISTSPTSANISGLACTQNVFAHMADTVATTSDYATMYLGMALANAADASTGANPDVTTETLMGQLVADGVMTDRKFALALSPDDGNGNVAASTLSFMDMGTTTTSSNKSGAATKTIQFDNNYFQWRTDLNGVWFGGEANGKFGLKDNKITVETGR